MSGNGATHRPQPVPVTLSMPIKAHGRELSELTLRPLTGKDLRICGTPYRISRGEEGIVDSVAVSAMISELAGVPLSSVDQLVAVDWFACWGAIQGFLGMTETAAPSTANQSSPAISTPAPSGAT